MNSCWLRHLAQMSTGACGWLRILAGRSHQAQYWSGLFFIHHDWYSSSVGKPFWSTISDMDSEWDIILILYSEFGGMNWPLLCKLRPVHPCSSLYILGGVLWKRPLHKFATIQQVRHVAQVSSAKFVHAQARPLRPGTSSLHCGCCRWELGQVG